MAKSVLISGGPTTLNASLTRHVALGTSFISFANGVLNRDMICRDPGVYSQLVVLISANAMTTDGTLTLLKNGSATALTVTLTAGFTGFKEDTTNQVSFADGDTIVWEVVSGATSSITIGAISVLFDATTNTKCMFGNAESEDYAGPASTTTFSSVGRAHTISTEVLSQGRIPTAGTLKHFYGRVTVNARANATTIRTRLDGLDGTIILNDGSGAVAAASTGNFEDSTHTDPISANALVNLSLAFGSGTDLLRLTRTSLTLETTNGQCMLIAGGSGNGAGLDELQIGAGVTTYLQWGGCTLNATEAAARIRTNQEFTYSKLWVYVSSNTSSLCTMTLRKSGVDTALTIPIGTGNGPQLDDTHSVVFSTTEELSLQIVNAGAGTLGIRTVTMLAEATGAGTQEPVRRTHFQYLDYRG